jgi:selenocysteine lyase/cysteine desulfurase
MRFFGATFDPSGLYRLNAVLGMLDDAGADARAIHAHAHGLQSQLIEALRRAPLAALPLSSLVPPEGIVRGNFLTFDLADAEAVEQKLAAANIGIDRRGRRLRFGFGVYHDADFVSRLLQRMRPAMA